MSQIMIGNIDAAVIEESARRLAEIRRLVGRLEGPSILEELRRDRDRDKK